PRFGVRLDRVNRAFRHANTAVNAFVRVDHEHVLALVETIHGAHLDAVHGFAANAALVDDIGQLSNLPADRSGELIRDVRPRGAQWTQRRPASSGSIGTPNSRHPRVDPLTLVESQYIFSAEMRAVLAHAKVSMRSTHSNSGQHVVRTKGSRCRVG